MGKCGLFVVRLGRNRLQENSAADPFNVLLGQEYGLSHIKTVSWVPLDGRLGWVSRTIRV